jgi:DNA-binding CsgD family transcriptional regulator
MFTFTDKQAGILSDIIHLAYRDILSTDVWTDMQTLIGELIPSDVSAAIFYDPDTRKPDRYANNGFDTSMYRDYAEHYYSREPILPHALAQGTYVWRPEDLVPRAVWEKTEFFADYLAPTGLKEFLTSIVKFDSGVSIWLRLARRQSDPFTDRDVQVMRLIQPHFAAAHEKTTCSAQTQAIKEAIFSSFDRTESPIFILDQGIHMVYMNNSARTLSSQSEQQSNAFLSNVATVAANIVKSDFQPLSMEGTPAETTLMVNGRRYALAMFPIHPGGSAPYYVMFASDVMRHVAVACRRSMQAFGLSPREAEICGLVVHGLSNRDIADRMCIAELTVKDHVKSIREKLKVTSRSKILLKLLSY